VAHPIDKQAGSRVGARWIALGMSQSKLADAVGLTFQQIQNMKSAAIGSARTAYYNFLTS
jgi:transcriptional regulator with XRE-family HTH domain